VDRTVGIFLLMVAFFLLVGVHLPGLIDAWAAEPTSTEYLADPVVFWLVKFMDLGLVVPGLVVVGTGLLRGWLWTDKAKYGAIAWAALLGTSVAGMAIVMQVNADPAAGTANTVVFSIFASIGLALAVVVHRILFLQR
jgi:hypothetical protein